MILNAFLQIILQWTFKITIGEIKVIRNGNVNGVRSIIGHLVGLGSGVSERSFLISSWHFLDSLEGLAGGCCFGFALLVCFGMFLLCFCILGILLCYESLGPT